MFMLEPVPALGPFTVGDLPPGSSARVLDDDGDSVDMDTTWPDTVLGRLTFPDATSSPTAVLIGDDPETVDFALPGGAFELPGVYQFTVRLADGLTEQDTAPLPIVVQDGSGWLDMATARALWPDAPTNDEALFLVLESARIACEAYAPALPDPVLPALWPPVPANYRQAQLAQARAIWNLMETAPQGDVIGFESNAVRVYPLDYNIRQLLRPKSGKPVLW